jgi:cellulose synthase (UDP-forming)
MPVSQPIPTSPISAPGPAVVNARVFRGWDYAGFVLLTALMWMTLIWLLHPWVHAGAWQEQPLCLAVMTLLLGSRVACQQFGWFLLPLMQRPNPMPPRVGWHVGVATTFVPGAESLDMLEATVTALVALAYPHDTWVLDEGDDAQVKALCAQLGARHFSRKSLAHYQTPQGPFQARSKHGNYNAWLDAVGFAQYDIVVNFDPDHVPQPTFLLEVLGYFDDPQVGYVQAAQAYYNQGASFIARGAAEETYAYYATTQMASYALGFPIVTGCHTAHRVTALQQVGGFAPHDADDLLITYRYRAAGWQGVYVPKILARGLTPVDWASYLTQQRRWARSVLDIKLRVYPRLAGRLPLRERLLGFLHGLYYVRGFTTGGVVGLLAGMLVTGLVPSVITSALPVRLVILYAVFQGTEFYKQRFFLGGWPERGLHWRAGLLQLAKWPYLLVALLEVLLDRTPPYQMTRKVQPTARRFLVIRAHLPIVLLIVLAWGVGVGRGHPVPVIVHLWAALVVLASGALMGTERWPFPAPYDPRLRECHARSGAPMSPPAVSPLLATQAAGEGLPAGLE